MKKLKLLIFSGFLFGTLLGAFGQDQDTVRSLIFTEWYSQSPTTAYLELTNMGQTTLDLSRFNLGYINANNGQFKLDDNGNLTINLGGNSQKRLSGTLDPGETFLVMRANYANDSIIDSLYNYVPDFVPTFKENLYEEADLVVYNQKYNILYHNGFHANVLFYRLDNGDSVMVDVVNTTLDENLKIIKEYSDVAGVEDASGYYDFVRKANITQGNVNWDKSAGIDATDSEWLLIPFQSYSSRNSYTTAGVHADFSIDVTSDIVDINTDNTTMKVPWGFYKGDSILTRLTMGPGMAWEYIQDSSYIDSTHTTIQDGDVLRLYATGNDLDVADYEFEVLAPTADMALVFPKRRKIYNDNNPFGTWQTPYYVTVQEPVMDTIGNVPYATRVDSLYKYLEKAPEAKWEIVWKDGIEKADLENGDILKVTSEDGNVVKEYFIDVQEYVASNNTSLSAIIWPDKSEFIEGWNQDTIPQFSPQKISYTVMVPYGSVDVPALQAIPEDINAKLDVKRAISLSGSLEERTTVFTVTAESDTVSQEYSVIFNVEKDPTKIQQYAGTPFFSEIACGQVAWVSFMEIVNPGTVSLDLSEYLIVRSTKSSSKGEVLESLIPENPTDADFQYLYRSYVPGYKYYEDTTEWLLDPGILSIDGNVNPIVAAGDVFVISAISEGKLPDVKPEYVAQADKLWTAEKRENPNADGIDVKSTVGSYIRDVQTLWLFKITNDSVLEGTKPVGDPDDYETVDVIGDYTPSSRFDVWHIAGGDQNSIYRGRFRPKPDVYTGARSIDECIERFGTSPDTSDWIDEPSDGYGDPNLAYSQTDIPAYIGSHTMNPVTVHLSTISSSIYLVSDGYVTVQSIQGDLNSTSASDFLANIDKRDTAQVLSLKSVADGSEITGGAMVAANDTLFVTSADGNTTTKYVLVNQPLSDNAVLTTVNTNSRLSITTTDATGTITGVEYGEVLKDVLDSLAVPDYARMNVIDGEGNLIPLHILNYDTTKTEVLVGNDIFLEVIAQDKVTTIVYKLEPASLSSDAFLISSVYNVDQDRKVISGIADGTAVDLLFSNIEAVEGAEVTLISKLENERIDGMVSYDDRLKVVSEDGSTTVEYYLTFQNETLPDMPNMAPTVSITADDEVMAQTAVTFTGEASDPEGLDLSFLWEVTSGNDADVTISSPDELSTEVTFNAEGVYELSLTVSDGENSTTATHSINVTPFVGVQMNELSGISVYPNPARNLLTVDMDNQIGFSSYKVSFFSITGRKLIEVKNTSAITEIDVSSFMEGIYILKIDTGNQRFVKRVEIMK